MQVLRINDFQAEMNVISSLGGESSQKLEEEKKKKSFEIVNMTVRPRRNCN